VPLLRAVGLLGELVGAGLRGGELVGGVGGCRSRAGDQAEACRSEHCGDSCNYMGMGALPAVKHERTVSSLSQTPTR
jgi:hypothetical protein